MKFYQNVVLTLKQVKYVIIIMELSMIEKIQQKQVPLKSQQNIYHILLIKVYNKSKDL